jgi:hypothetical protein
MASRKGPSCLAGVGLVCLALAGCGGAGSSSGSSAPAAPAFSISISPINLALVDGGAGGTVQVTATAQGGFTGSISVSAGSLPSGVSVSPASLSFTPGSAGTFTFSASKNAGSLQQSISIDANSGTLTSNSSFQLNTTFPSAPDPCHPVGGSMVHGFYDESRQLLFATNIGLNEVDVISGADFSVKARVPVPQPLGIDQMADGKTLVIGTEAQEIVTLNEDTYDVLLYPHSAVANYAYSLFFPTLVAMANGKVLVIGQEQGIDSNNIVDGGQVLFEWDSNADTLTQIDPTGNGNPSWEVDSLARSADHKWAVFSGDRFYLYSSDSDNLTFTSLNNANPPQGLFGIRGYAINSDGSLIAAASATQVTFMDASLDVLASTPIPGAFQTSRTAVQFSEDGSKLYLQYDFPVTIQVIDAKTFTALGYLSGTAIPDDDNLERMLTTDSKGRAYVGIDEGLRIVDLTQPPVPNTTFSPNPYGCPFSSAVLPLNTPMQLQLTNTYTSLNVFVGGQPAPLLQGGTSINIPASSKVGPADVVCVDSYGDNAVVPNGVSYGVEPVGFSANLLPPFGNPIAYLFGYGLVEPPFGPASSVEIGGKTASNISFSDELGIGTIQAQAIDVPNGTAGSVAGISVSGPLGTGSLPSATKYYASPTIIPASGILQILFDSHRNRLYALKANEVDILDTASLKWLPPLTFPSTANQIFNSIELTPDGSNLVVGALGGNTGPLPQFIVLDPDNILPATLLSDSVRALSLGSMAITKFNTVVMPGDPGLVLDLSTLSFTSLPYFDIQLAKATPDGSHLYGAIIGASNGEVASIDPSTYAVQSEGFGFMFWSDLAVSPDGSHFAAVFTSPGAAGDLIGFFNSKLQYFNSNVYPDFSPPDDSGVLGATFSPQGTVLVVPLGDSIEIWDATLGTLRARLMTPEELLKNGPSDIVEAPMMAIDSAGKTIYAASVSGITVLTLPEPLDQIPATEWPTANVGLHGASQKGAVSSRIGAMRSKNSVGRRRKSAEPSLDGSRDTYGL